MVSTAAQIWRNWETDGVPSSGLHDPDKIDIRAWGSWVEGVIAAFTANGGLIYSSKALLDADLAHAANSMAWVLGDANVANNGVYGKVGASGLGSWVRRSDLPFSFIIAADAGAGTPNAIKATTTIPVSSSALVWMNIFETNTSSPVTVQFNSGPVLTIKTATGNNPANGGLVGGMIVLGIVSGSTFRLVSDQASSAIVAAAEAAAAAAEASLANSLTIVSNAGALPAMTINNGINYLRTNGYSLANGRGASGYRLMGGAEADVYGQLTSNGGAKRWAPDMRPLEDVTRYGVSMSGDVADTEKFANLLVGIGPKCYLLPPGELWLDETIELTSIVSGAKFVGAGREQTRIACKAELETLFHINGGCNSVTFENILFDVSGYETKVFFSEYADGESSGEFRFINCTFIGDQPGDLVRLGLFGDGYVFENCVWLCRNNGLWGLTLDTGPHNIIMFGGRMYGDGGAGLGVRVTQSDASLGAEHRVEGLCIIGTQFLLGGSLALQIGSSLWTTIVGACIDQFSDTGVQLTGNSNGGADCVELIGCYFGSNGNVGIGITPECGNGVKVLASDFNNVQYAVYIAATLAKRTAGHLVQGNSFRNIGKSAVRDDSSGAAIVGNSCLFSAVSEGAYHFLDTNGGGIQATLSNNTGATSIVVDPNCSIPLGSGNTGDGRWLDHKSVSVGLSANLPTTSGVAASVSWNVEDFDPIGAHSSGDLSGLYVPKGVKVVELHFYGEWASNSTGTRKYDFYVNGVLFATEQRSAAGVSGFSWSSGPIACNPGDYFAVVVTQDSGTGLLFSNKSKFKMRCIG